MVNKTLKQVLLDRSINFDKAVSLPPRLVYKQNKIKTLQLFGTFLDKGPVTMTWSKLPSKVDFKSSLEIDKCSRDPTQNPSKRHCCFWVKAIKTS